MFGNPTDSGEKMLYLVKTRPHTKDIFTPLLTAIAVAAGLMGCVLGSTHPIASALVSAFAGAIVSSVTMAICVVSLPHHEFGEREIVVAICGGAVIFAVLTLCCTKLVTIVTSSIVGATLIILAVDFFMHDLGTLKWVSGVGNFSHSTYNNTFLLPDDHNPSESRTATVLGRNNSIHVASGYNRGSTCAEFHHGMACGPQEATLSAPAVARGEGSKEWNWPTTQSWSIC